MRKPREKLAKFKQVLEYTDGPQAVLLERSADAKIVAVAIDLEGYKSPFFGAEISIEQWDRYRRGLVDLNYLFVYPRYKNWFIFDLAKQRNGFIRLIPTEKNDFAIDEYIPEKGFWLTTTPRRSKRKKTKLVSPAVPLSSMDEFYMHKRWATPRSPKPSAQSFVAKPIRASQNSYRWPLQFLRAGSLRAKIPFATIIGSG